MLALIAGVLGCAPANQNLLMRVGDEVTVESNSFPSEPPPTSYELFPNYKIKPGDVLDVLFQIQTWTRKENFEVAIDNTIAVKFDRAPELNEEQRVRPDGMISLPYVGSVYVIGKTVTQLEDDLKKRYAKILRDPQLHVVVSDFRSAIKELKVDLHTAPRGLSRLVTVRPDGYVTFPMVGETMVAGRTITEVGTELNQKYETILPGLHCDLFLEQHSGNVVYVVGEVKKPGSYPIPKPITVVQAITIAGSITTEAEREAVMVVRRKGNQFIATRVDLQATMDFSTKTPFFFLQPDDIVIVPRTRISESAQISNYIKDIIMFKGWGLWIDAGNAVQISN